MASSSSSAAEDMEHLERETRLHFEELLPICARAFCINFFYSTTDCKCNQSTSITLAFRHE
jgi:hypothetical protein